MPPDRDQYIAARKLHARAEQYRGEFLNKIAVIERKMGELLTEYFCTSDAEKQQLFRTRIAGRMSLEDKRNLLLAIVQSDYPTMATEQAEFLKDLSELQKLRNKLAHSVVDVSEEALARDAEEGVGFVQWKDGAPISETEFNDWCVRANMVSGALDDIKSLLPYKERRNAV